MAQLTQGGSADAAATQRIATCLYWAAAAGADVALTAGRELSDMAPALGVAGVCEAAVFLALWAYMRGVRWAAAPTAARAHKKR